MPLLTRTQALHDISLKALHRLEQRLVMVPIHTLEVDLIGRKIYRVAALVFLLMEPIHLRTSFSGDPFTGGGAYRTSTSQPAPVSTPSLLPHRTPLTFSQKPNFAPLKSKVLQFTEQLQSEDPELALTDGEKAIFDLLIAALDSALDLVRLLCTIRPSPDLISPLLSSLDGATITNQKEWETNSMLALRALSNLAATQEGAPHVQNKVQEIADTLTKLEKAKLSKNGKIALATVLLNVSVITVTTGAEAASVIVTTWKVLDLLTDEDSEVVYRTLMAVGNLIHSKQPKSVATATSIKGLIANLAKSSKEDRIKQLSSEIISLLSI
ncbi:hypothetical protein BT69DRAFT_1051075 [Atractiella rhizophila]|nr:hypothetical protein BT69DRAFT_1051075 [Atractiella rhizophila]